MKTFKKNLILLGIVVLLFVTPLVFNKNAEYGGADGYAEEAITEINPNYEPWFESFWEPPSGEIESLLFSLQAGIGAGIIGYYFGFMKGKRKSAYNR
nr:energy-coupling factor ABC transporter substrate-binding protein [Tepidibacter mesophilus]